MPLSSRREGQQGTTLVCPGGDYFISGLPEVGPVLLESLGLDTVPAVGTGGMAQSVYRAWGGAEGSWHLEDATEQGW